MTTVVTELFPDLGPLPFPSRYFSDIVNKSQLRIYLWSRKLLHTLKYQADRPQSVLKEYTHLPSSSKDGRQTNKYVFKHFTCDAIKCDILKMWFQRRRHCKD